MDEAISQAVIGLRKAGYSRAEIAGLLGITRQAAQQRWGRRQRPFKRPALGPFGDHTLAGTIPKRPAAPLVRDEEAATGRASDPHVIAGGESRSPTSKPGPVGGYSREMQGLRAGRPVRQASDGGSCHTYRPIQCSLECQWP